MQGMLWLLVLTTAVPWLPRIAASCRTWKWKWLSSCMASLGKFFPAWSCRQFADRWFTSLHSWWWCCGARPAAVSMPWPCCEGIWRHPCGEGRYVSGTFLDVRASYCSHSFDPSKKSKTLIRKKIYDIYACMNWTWLNVIDCWLLWTTFILRSLVALMMPMTEDGSSDTSETLDVYLLLTTPAQLGQRKPYSASFLQVRLRMAWSHQRTLKKSEMYFRVWVRHRDLLQLCSWISW